MKRLITILGPTAVGKTELTLRLAERLDAEIISGDAFQVYREFDIGTAKPTAEELSRVPHHLVDCLAPEGSYSAAVFQKEAERIIDEIDAREKVPILSGGTGLYVQSLIEGYGFSEVPPNAAVRERLDRLVKEAGIDGLRMYAERLADEAGTVLPFFDEQRLYRIVERLEAGDVASVVQPNKEGLRYEGPVIGISRPRDELYTRIERRVDMMIAQGLIEEVESLLRKGISTDCQAFSGIGYKEIVAYLSGACDRETAIDLVKRNTRRFAKRQLTWYRRMPYIQWIDGDAAEPAALRILDQSGFI